MSVIIRGGGGKRRREEEERVYVYGSVMPLSRLRV